MTSSSAGDSGLVELSSSLVAAGNGATLDVDLEALPPGLGLPFLRTFGVSAASDPAFLAALRVKGIIYITKGGVEKVYTCGASSTTNQQGARNAVGKMPLCLLPRNNSCCFSERSRM